MNRIIIGALTAWKHAERRQRCLDSWIPQVLSLGMPSYFLFAATNQNTEFYQPRPHELMIRVVVDSYSHLAPMTHGFCRWALHQPDWDYLFKCDDDTYIHASRLFEYPAKNRDYIGAEWRRGVGYGSGGAGYLLSRRAAEIVARQPVPGRGAEDKWVGNILRNAEVPFSIEPRFIPFGNLDRRPRPNNDVITTHSHTEAFLASAGEFA
jgi:hypothetical protein